jgi:RNA polymerase sigma-70 factor (ECF subfamily)
MGLTILAVTRPTDSPERQAAFERSVIPETTRLFRIALAIVDDPGEAEDVVQDTIIIAWRRWATLEAFANPSAWLTRVCVRQCVRRRRFLRRRTFWTPEQWSVASSNNPDFTGPMLDLHRAYRHLSPSQRAVVTLHLRDGLTVNECAALLGIRPGTARSHLGRGLNKLRRELKDA